MLARLDSRTTTRYEAHTPSPVSSSAEYNYAREVTDFVPREGIEVNTKFLDIDFAVGCVGHAIDADKGPPAVGVDRVCDGLDVVDSAQDVARMREGHEPCPRT